MSSQDGGRLISALYLAGLVIWLYCNADGVTPDSVRAAIVLGAILTLGYLIVNLWQRHSREKRDLPYKLLEEQDKAIFQMMAADEARRQAEESDPDETEE